jgi:error-prone DNA polymerase
MEDGSRVRVSGMVIIIHTPPTKSGKRVIFLTLEDYQLSQLRGGVY